MELSGLTVPDISVCLTSKSKEVFFADIGEPLHPFPKPSHEQNPKISHHGKYSRGDSDGTETTCNILFCQSCILHFKGALSILKIGQNFKKGRKSYKRYKFLKLVGATMSPGVSD